MQDVLDNPNVVAQKDPFDALGVAAKEWTQLAEKPDVVGTLPPRSYRQVVVTGMGGSGMAAGMVKDWANLSVPFEVVKGYDLPAYVSSETLVIASSYSGNTEETLSAAKEAIERDATVAVIASGGALLELAKERELPYVQLRDGVQPRMAVFANLVALLSLLEAMSICEGKLAEIAGLASWLSEASARWEAVVPSDLNLAKQLAMHAAGKTPVIYASSLMRSVAYKWKISFNENAKTVAFWNELPEFNHNEFIGWSSHPVEKPYAVFDLRSEFDHPQIAKRFEISDRLLSGMRPKAEVIELEGETAIAQMLWGGVLADFVSIYLAILNGVDPTKVELIEKLKSELK